MESDRPSKSAKKRAMTALQDLGQTLVELPREALLRVPMPEDLSGAVHEARAIRDHEGRRRQLQYIGKLMRQVDPQPIQEALAEIRGESSKATARLHQVEAWRERLINEEDALNAFTGKYVSDASRIGELRSTIRAARKERTDKRPPKHQRALFQTIKSMIGETDE